MTRLDRYIIRSVLLLSALIALALVTIYSFTTFVADLDETGRGNYGLLHLAGYTALNLPAGLHTLLPIIAMLGTLMGLGQMAAQSEIIAIRAAGVSNLRIGVSVLMAGVLVGAFGWLLGDWVAPAGRQAAEALRTEARYGIDSGASFKPIWLREGPHVVRIGKLIAEDRIEQGVIYTLAEDLSLQAITTVESARYQAGKWVFSGVRRTQFGPQGASLETLAEMEWSGGLAPEVLRLFVLEARSLSTQGLMRLIDYLEVNGLDASIQKLNLWKKLVAPTTVMAMMLFAVPFVFGSLRSSGAGLRLLVGVMIGVGFYVVNEVSTSLGQLYGLPPMFSAGLPTVALTLIALWRLGLRPWPGSAGFG